MTRKPKAKLIDPFEVYRMPVGMTDGVEIPLPNTDAVFTVRLPSSLNEDYQMALMKEMNVSFVPGETVNIDINPGKFQIAQRKIFIEKCVLSAKGLPKKTRNIVDFFAAYPLAARLLFDKAVDLAAEADKQMDVAMGKSKPLPNGATSGEGNTTSTIN